MPWWIGSAASTLLAAGVFALLAVRSLGTNTINIVYYHTPLCEDAAEVHRISNGVIGNDNSACTNIDDSMTPIGDTMTRGYKVLCASDSWDSASYAATSMLINIDNAGCQVSAQGATLNYEMPLQNVCWKPQGDRSLWLIWQYVPNSASLCGEPLPVAPSPSVQGDPVTWHGLASGEHVREEFVLPPGMLSPLLQSPDMQVLASSRPGHKKDEWIDRVVVTSAVGEQVLDVAIKRNLSYFNRAALLPNSFETLDVRMDWWRSGLLSIMPPGDAQFNHWSGISMAFGRVRHFGELKAGPAPRREAVYITSSSLKILILSSAAREYFLERDGFEKYLSMEYSHLDLEIMEIGNQSDLRGILPELWGLIPMSEETKALRKEPTDLIHGLVDGPRGTIPTSVENIKDNASLAFAVDGFSGETGAQLEKDISPDVASITM